MTIEMSMFFFGFMTGTYAIAFALNWRSLFNKRDRK